MNSNFKDAFDSIKADLQLKDSTYVFLQSEIAKRSQKPKIFKFNRFVYVAITCVFLMVCGVKGYSFYFEEISFVSIDINPSIELTLNRFDRVISVKAYNDDGKKIIKSLNVKNKSYNDALEILINNDIFKKYINNNSYVSFAVQSNDIKKENTLLTEVQNSADNLITAHHKGIQVNCSTVDDSIRQQAHGHGMSVGKYQAILELQEFNPDINIDDYRNTSMKDIKTIMEKSKKDNNYNSNNFHNNNHNGYCH